MTRLGGGQGQGDGLRIAHLPHQDDLRRLAEGGAERGGEAGRVTADLDLLDQAAAMGEDVLDRILEREYVAGARLQQARDEGRERRRLPGPRGAGDEHEPAPERGEARDHVGEVQLLQAPGSRLEAGGP